MWCGITESESCQEEVADVVFVLDSSGSITMDNWVKVLDFVNSIVGALPIGMPSIQVSNSRQP